MVNLNKDKIKVTVTTENWWKWSVIWLLAFWGDPDLIDAIIYFLTKNG